MDALSVKSLKPHWESATPRIPSRPTSQLKTRPAASLCGRALTDTAGSMRAREPMTMSAPVASAGSSRLSSAIGVAPSASVKSLNLPVAASMPARTAAPLPRLRPSGSSRTAGLLAASTRTAAAVPSVEPSSTTTTSYTSPRPSRKRITSSR
jgi:hypothetical protein